MKNHVQAKRFKSFSHMMQNQPEPAWGKLLSAIINCKISTSVALSLVLFFAVSAGAIALVARTEIASVGYQPPLAFENSGKILGVASYGYNQPVCNRGNCLNHELIGYNGSGWQVRIDYQLREGIVGAIRFNNRLLVDNITGSGSAYTGYELLPGKTYNFVLYGKKNDRLRRLVRLRLTAPRAPELPTSPPPYGYYCPQDAYQCPDGTWVGRTGLNCEFVCPTRPVPTPPPYGYYTPSVDLEIRDVKETSQPNSLMITACMHGPKSINDLKKENSKVQNFPFNYVVYGADEQKYEFVSNAGGGIEDIKHGQCMEFGTAVQLQHQAHWQATKKITIILDPYNYIAESSEYNNQYTYQGEIKQQASISNVRLSETGLYTGQTYRIKWDSTGIEKVYIKLRKNSAGDTVRAISDTIVNQGFYYWTVPTDLPSGDDYVIRVVNGEGKVFGDSAAFTIKDGVTTVAALPDYAVTYTKTDENVVNGQVKANLEFNLWFYVQNYGDQNVMPDYSFAYDGQQPLSSAPEELLSTCRSLTTLSRNQSCTLVLKVKYPGAAQTQSAKITLTLNPQGTIKEQSRENNSGYVKFEVLGSGGSAISAFPTYHYIKIETPVSNSAVAWREIEIYDANGSKISPIGETISSSVSGGSEGKKAYDGDVYTAWNSGSYNNAAIVLDLGADQQVSKIRLLPANYPNPATTTHYVRGKAAGGTFFESITSFGGQIYDNQWLTYGFSNP